MGKSLQTMLFTCVLMASGASMAQQASKLEPRLHTGAPVDQQTTGPADLISVPLIQFGNSFMTDVRARQIAKTSDLSFLRWFPCAQNAQHCMVLEAAGKAGRIFQYHMIDDLCAGRPELDQTQSLSVDTGSIQKPRLPVAKMVEASRTAKPSQEPATASHPVDDVVEPEGKAVSCLGGWRVLTRARQENSYLADNFGFYLGLNQTFQIVSNGRWTPLFEYSLDTWQLPVGSLTEQGHAFEVLSPEGDVIASGGESFQWIASSGSTDVSVAERCDAKRDVYVSKVESAIAMTDAKCTMAGWLVPYFEVTGAFAPAGMGGTGTVGFSTPFCAPVSNVATKNNARSGAEMYADCLENPGRYFPSDYPPVMQPLILDASSGYLPVVPEEITLTGDCPAYTTVVSTYTIGNLDCNMSTPYECAEVDGKCKCNKVNSVGSRVETVCTDF